MLINICINIFILINLISQCLISSFFSFLDTVQIKQEVCDDTEMEKTLNNKSLDQTFDDIAMLQKLEMEVCDTLLSILSITNTHFFIKHIFIWNLTIKYLIITLGKG